MSMLFGGIARRSIDHSDFGEGGWTSDVSIRGAGKRLVPQFAAERIIASNIAMLPLQQYRRTNDGRKSMQLGQLLRQPASRGSRRDWLYRCGVSLARSGNAFGLITSRDSLAYPTTIDWLDPLDMSIKDDNTAVEPEWYWKGRRLDNDQLVHFANHVEPGKVVGLSPVKAFRAVHELGELAMQYAAGAFKDGASPAGIISTNGNLTDANAEKVKRKFKKAARGRDIVVIPKDWDWTGVNARAEDLQYLATVKATAGLIGAIHGIGPEELGGEAAGGSLTYSTVELNQIKLQTGSIENYLVLIEEGLEPLLPGGQYARFNRNARIRSDAKSRWDIHRIRREIGAGNVNEIRALEDEDPIDDEYGATYAPLGQLTKTNPEKEPQR